MGMIARHSTSNDDFEWQNPTATTQHTLVEANPSMLRTVANLAQHHQFYKDIVQRQSNLSLVLEDDATFVPCFKSQLEQIIAELPSDFNGITFIGTCMHRHAPRSFYGKTPTRVTEHLWEMPLHRCANGYLISLKAAQAITSIAASQVAYGFRNIDPALESYLFRLFPHFYWSEPALVYESSKAFSPALATRWMAWNLPRSSVGGEESYRELNLWANLVEYTSRKIERWWWDAPTISCFLAVLLIAGYGYTINQLLRSELRWLYSKLKSKSCRSRAKKKIMISMNGSKEPTV